MSVNKTAINYRRLQNVRYDLRVMPDLRETSYPRFATRTLPSHRRGQKRFEVWAKYVADPLVSD